jgi:tetratricopeptide (TPR) repeat protein
LDINPKDLYALWSFFNLSARRGDGEAMRQYHQRLQEAAPTNPFVEVIPVHIAVVSGQMEEARALSAAFLDKPVADWERYDRLCGAAEGWADYGFADDAIKIVEKATKLPKAERDPRADVVLGECYMQLGEYEKAEAAFTRATRAALPRERPHVLLAALYLHRGEFDAADRELANARRIQPTVDIDKVQTLVRLARGDHADARLLAERSLAADSTRASHELLAWVLIKSDVDVEQGMREAEVAASLDYSAFDDWQGQSFPMWPVADHSLGLAYLKHGKPRDAVRHLELAAQKAPARESIVEDLKRAKEILAESP